MEESGNIFERGVIGTSKTKVGKPPTRLQKHAPQSLKLDQMKAHVDQARSPIPLLTPLTVSPSPFPETDEFMFPTPKDVNAAATPTSSGQKQAVGAGFNVEAYTFLPLFQNKCVLVNGAK
ncbi:hypothetical protein F3Y22_tig00001644pilonHSYRG00360 [Hibiscus syriacus]|uniref:Uncharacterized protein n=1 Tax=Hibiscus syriacus TaxID=106335 RepID=A0A6A3CV93_HIBSY|nr:uncharacterized protein LOC120130179 [Hibiscus syriacus]KAE8733026.1 hypothetical protein F3Y22_tig00001644pilonHSYRG00360 [Hibiscus syriacus]